MAVDRPIADRDAVRIGLVHELLTRLHDARPPRERLQEQELGDRERHLPPFQDAARRSGSSVKRPDRRGRSSVCTRAGVGQRRAPQQHFDARHELAHRERLAQVVVGADLQSEHAIELVFARRDEDDRQRLRARAQPPAQLEAVDPRQADVENRQIGQRPLECVPRASPIGERLGAVAFAAQRKAASLPGSSLRLRRRSRAVRRSAHRS